MKYTCTFCGNEIEDQKHKRKFCSNQCQADFRWSKAKKKIQDTGIASGKYGRRFLKETDGEKCKVCGTSEWCGLPLVLILDHIDGNSSNWRIENLRFICANCDSQTPTFKNRNKGNGRYARRIRYQQGKSF